VEDMARRLQLPQPRSEAGEVGSQITTSTTSLWLVAGPRAVGFPLGDDAQRLVDGLAATASASLDSAELLDRVRHQAVTCSPSAVVSGALGVEDPVKDGCQVSLTRWRPLACACPASGPGGGRQIRGGVRSEHLVAEEVVEGLPPHDLAGLAVADEHDGRP
jgi:hypothetical protein